VSLMRPRTQNVLVYERVEGYDASQQIQVAMSVCRPERTGIRILEMTLQEADHLGTGDVESYCLLFARVSQLVSKALRDI